MNETVMYAKYNQEANKTIYGLLSNMSNDEREKDRGSYYGSLSGLFRHIMGGTLFFLDMYKTALQGNAAAVQAISAAGSVSLPEGPLTEVQWKELEKNINTLDNAYSTMALALTEADASLPIKIDWYGGNPPEVPLSFMLYQLVVHNTHHRGQLSQILDSLKIDNDYSGINAAFINPGHHG